MVLFCAADLLWATRIKSTADALGIACRPARNTEMLRARLADSPVRALIVDLEAETALELIRDLRAAGKGAVRVVAFGPHVAVQAFEDARAAGADAVMARGAFSARLPAVLKQLSEDRTPESELEE